MTTIRVSTDVAKFKAALGATMRKQMPFATALALTTVAKAAQGATEGAMPSVFDRPIPFTQRGVAIQPATKAKPIARVFFKDRQAAYLALQETGGARKPRKKALLMPEAAKVNQHGNMRRSTFEGLKRNKNTFVGTINGASGLWRRPKRGTRSDGTYGNKGSPELMVAFEASATYRPRLGFNARAERVVRATIGPAMRNALALAMRGKK